MKTYIGKLYENEQNSNSTLAVYQYGWQKCKPNHSYGPAVWYHYALHYVVKGKGIFTYDGKSHVVNAGECFVIFPGKTAFYKADPDDPWEYRWINFAGTEARKLLEKSNITNKNLTTPCENREEIVKLFEALYKNSKSAESKEYAMIGYLYLIFSCLVKKPVYKEKPAQIYLNSAIEYIDNHYFYRITVEEVARSIGIERSYLYKIFKRELGYSVSDYIQKCKIQNAKKFLIETNISTAEIANSLNFDSSSHFSKSFKKHTGFNPSEYRKNHQKIPD